MRSVSPSDPRKLGSTGDVTPSDPRKLGSTGDVTRHHFDADTALEPAGDGRWRAWAPDHWFVGRGPNGGFLAGVAARAAEAAAGRPLRSLSLHFVAAPAVGPLDVTATIEREGRSYSAASVRIDQGGRPMTLALATLGELPDGGAAWDAGAMPAATPLEQTEPVPLEQAGIPAFMRNYDMRWALGAETGLPETGGWIRTTEPRALDGPLVAAMTDAWAPAAFVALGRFVAAPTLDLTIHVRRPLPVPGMAPEDHVLGRFSSGLSVSGVWEEDGELWTPGGELIAQSRQLALVRELPG
jgi:acyl-CoA thioesterase